MPPDGDRSEKERSEELTLLKEIRSLIDRIHDGDEGAVPRLREILRKTPDLARRFVDPAVQAERSMIEVYGGKDAVVRETLPRTLEAVRATLAGGSPSPLEQLLVERVVATWLQLHYFEAAYAQNMASLTIPQGEWHQKRIDRAHRRHLSAIKTLAQVRKMGPAMQVNIAEKQINTAG